jgi:hypothetical protein
VEGRENQRLLGHFRHLVVRYDRKLNIYQAFFLIACFVIVSLRLGNSFLSHKICICLQHIKESTRSPLQSPHINFLLLAVFKLFSRY